MNWLLRIIKPRDPLVGEVFQSRRGKNPFAPVTYVQVLDAKDGWVLYRYMRFPKGGGLQRESMKIRDFYGEFETCETSPFVSLDTEMQ